MSGYLPNNTGQLSKLSVDLQKHFSPEELATMSPLEQMSIANRIKNYELLNELGFTTEPLSTFLRPQLKPRTALKKGKKQREAKKDEEWLPPTLEKKKGMLMGRPPAAETVIPSTDAAEPLRRPTQADPATQPTDTAGIAASDCESARKLLSFNSCGDNKLRTLQYSNVVERHSQNREIATRVVSTTSLHPVDDVDTKDIFSRTYGQLTANQSRIADDCSHQIGNNSFTPLTQVKESISAERVSVKIEQNVPTGTDVNFFTKSLGNQPRHHLIEQPCQQPICDLQSDYFVKKLKKSISIHKLHRIKKSLERKRSQPSTTEQTAHVRPLPTVAGTQPQHVAEMVSPSEGSILTAEDVQTELPSSFDCNGTQATDLMAADQLVDSLAEKYRTFLRYFLPPNWVMNDESMSALRLADLASFPVDELFNQYENGFPKFLSHMRKEAESSRAEYDLIRNNLSSLSKNAALLLKYISNDCVTDDTANSSDRVSELLQLCIDQNNSRR